MAENGNKEIAMPRHGFLTRMFFLAGIAGFAAGCSSSPIARFYTLNPLGHQEASQPAPLGAHPVSVSIAPVEIPDYLDRNQIVTRDGSNALKLAEFDRWGGSLDENITSVLVENLSGLLASYRVAAYPRLWPEKPDYWVGVRVLRLDCMPGDRVELKAQWLVTAEQDRQVVANKIMTFTERLNDSRYDTLAAGVSGTIGHLSREIAREIEAHSKGTAGSTTVQATP